VIKRQSSGTVATVFLPRMTQGFSGCSSQYAETVKTVNWFLHAKFAGLKPGVNERVLDEH